MKEIRLGRLRGLELSAAPSALIGSLILWVVLSAIAVAFLNLSTGEAVAGALAATAVHWISDTVHQLGHARAAEQSGHPMTGIRYWGVLSSSLYPADEPPLPAVVHIRRALGGPTMSALVTFIAAALTFVLRLAGVGGAFWWLTRFFLLDNLLVMMLGPFLPLGFTDGSTLLHWWNKP